MLEKLIQGMKSFFQTDFDPERRQAFVEIGKGLGALALVYLGVSSLSGCGKKAAPAKPGEVSGAVEYLDDVLETAQKQIQQGQYSDAIKALEGYSSDKKDALASRHILLADAYYGFFKAECQRRNGAYSRDDVGFLNGLAEKINTNLQTAESLNPEYRERKWTSCLKCSGQVQAVNDLSTPANALKTFIYAGAQKEFPTLEKIFGAIAKKEFEAELVRSEKMINEHVERAKAYNEIPADKIRTMKEEAVTRWKERYQQGWFYYNSIPGSLPLLTDNPNVYFLNIGDNNISVIIIKKQYLSQFRYAFEKTSEGFKIKEAQSQTISK